MLTKQRDEQQEAPSPHESRGLPLLTATIASIMAFSYPRFNSEIHTTSHIWLFLNVWNSNHMVQLFPEAEAHKSKIAEFGLTMDGPAACCDSQMDLVAITTFDQLQSAFFLFSHRRVL